jgi:hypothetical protein
LSADQAAAVLDLEYLRRRAVSKLGDLASKLFLTHDGLEQATRWAVALWRAERLVQARIARVVDAGCGLGIDALACQRAGLAVIGVERDPVVAIFAEANLLQDRQFPSQSPTVLTSAIEDLDLTDWLIDEQTAIFLDPARRTPAGRSWQIGDLSPSWEFVSALTKRSRGWVVAKLAPGFPRNLLPTRANVAWVSERGDLVETSLWSGRSTGQREAVVLADQPHTLTAGGSLPPLGPIGAYLYEPDPAIIRAQAIGHLTWLLQAHPLAPNIAYLSGDELVETPFATAFAVVEVLDYSEKALRAWAKDHQIGVMEIKVRGLDIDPAALRRRLQLKGPNSTTVILTPTPGGSKMIVASRLVGGEDGHSASR